MGRGADAARERARYHWESELDHQEMQLRGRLTLRPNDPSLHARLARVLQKRGRPEEAKAELEAELKLRGGATAYGRSERQIENAKTRNGENAK
jgi:hypothetical protein